VISTTTSTLFTVTPPCLHGATLTFAGAWMEYSDRTLCASLREPGRCAHADYLTLDVTFREHRRGETRLSIHRRVAPNDHQRVSLPEKSAKVLETELNAALALFHGGFERAWLEAFAAHRALDLAAGAAAAVERAFKLIDHARKVEQLALAVAEGNVIVRYIPRGSDSTGRSLRRQVASLSTSRNMENDYSEAACTIENHAGEVLGWITQNAAIAVKEGQS
jgi:hypothetical protein